MEHSVFIMNAIGTGNLAILEAKEQDIPVLWDIVHSMGAAREPGYFERQYSSQIAGQRRLLIAWQGEKAAGYGVLNWQPKYPFFQKLNIPEIQDLNVLPQCRGRGLARSIIAMCEEEARTRGHDYMGISVGLHSGFGAAQRLYARLGYIPDGQGVTYDRAAVQAGEFRPVDDHLCLMMLKSLHGI
jgi:GNAT superfamily N-acetyltransferase